MCTQRVVAVAMQERFELNNWLICDYNIFNTNTYLVQQNNVQTDDPLTKHSFICVREKRVGIWICLDIHITDIFYTFVQIDFQLCSLINCTLTSSLNTIKNNCFLYFQLS